MKEKLKQKKGITLIALVITIIVLLILAGVSIAMLTGQNGILTQAQNAKERTEQAEKDEKTDLDATEDLINQYAGIDWDTVLFNAEKHPEQKISTAIGVGTNGKPVNMDLWEYNYDDITGGYGLNDITSLTTSASSNASKGYEGTDFDNIVIPQYISVDEGESWTPVTNLNWTFFNCTELKQINKLPDTVKSMRYTFRGCSILNTINQLPSELENMEGTFYDCINLNADIYVPSNVTNMHATFGGCSSLKNAPNIPSKVTTMSFTFANCTNLILGPEEIPNTVTDMNRTFFKCNSLTTVSAIPNSVTNMNRTFYDCSSLTGIITINANLTGALVSENENDYYHVFYNAATNDNCQIELTGECQILQDIVNYTNRSNIKLLTF